LIEGGREGGREGGKEGEVKNGRLEIGRRVVTDIVDLGGREGGMGGVGKIDVGSREMCYSF
jgi:hypothetical protein